MKNWRTTLAGIGLGALQLFVGGMNWKSILLSAAMAALGAVAKDANVTGGSIVQPTPAAALNEKAAVDGAVK